ncbi:SRPBCC family protein [Granulicoccus phenolivorans]|uniref:SRPBCC family protein n=1 Tax=Granulicoccus phenolivorans TaxID=266854 RepID=UPI00041DC7C2|nr:SRPBCC domain-containing protein [Granulicoccus phenolivorans]
MSTIQPDAQQSRTGNLTATVTVPQPPEQVFGAITDVRGWWSENLIGNSAALHDEFVFTDDSEYAGQTARSSNGIRYARFRLTEVVPGRRMVWHVVDCHLNFVADHREWADTHVVFDLAPTPEGTTVHFTHEGLTAAESECFDACSRGWTFYITRSLPDLIATGTGRPITRYHS